MVFQSPERMSPGLLARFARRRFAPNRSDLIALLLIARPGRAGRPRRAGR